MIALAPKTWRFQKKPEESAARADEFAAQDDYKGEAASPFAQVLIKVGSRNLDPPTADMVGGPRFAGPGVGAGSASQSSSQETLCWSKPDSNRRSPSRKLA